MGVSERGGSGDDEGEAARRWGGGRRMAKREESRRRRERKTAVGRKRGTRTGQQGYEAGRVRETRKERIGGAGEEKDAVVSLRLPAGRKTKRREEEEAEEARLA